MKKNCYLVFGTAYKWNENGNSDNWKTDIQVGKTRLSFKFKTDE